MLRLAVHSRRFEHSLWILDIKEITYYIVVLLRKNWNKLDVSLIVLLNAGFNKTCYFPSPCESHKLFFFNILRFNFPYVGSLKHWIQYISLQPLLRSGPIIYILLNMNWLQNWNGGQLKPHSLHYVSVPCSNKFNYSITVPITLGKQILIVWKTPVKIVFSQNSNVALLSFQLDTQTNEFLTW